MKDNTLSMKTQNVLGLILALVLVVGLVLAAAPRFQYESYIVQGPDLARVEQIVTAYGGKVTARLEIISGLAADLTAAAAEDVKLEAGISSVFPNAAVESVSAMQQDANGQAIVTDYADAVGADYVWGQGITGKGVTVAIVDSGLVNHPAFQKDTDGKNVERIIGFVDLVDGKKSANDPSGHGTHVAGIIGNSLVGGDGEFNGVAPDVNLVAVRVLNADGSSTYSKVIEGVQWVVAHKDQYNIRVLNLSLVAPVVSPYWADPLNQAVTAAWAEGIVVVVAAGNEGSDPLTITVPGNNPYVITVGAFTDNYTPDDWSDDYITPFSSAGPTYDAFVKPDVVAPGGHIVSTMLPSSYLGKEYKQAHLGSGYYSLAGTSQAAAVISGVTALVLEANPDLTPDEVKYRLQYTAFPWVDVESGDALYSIWQQGHGRVSAPDATFADVEGNANAGMDIQADLAGTTHYQGYTIYDETTGEFRLAGFGNWAGKFGNWAGKFGNWAGGFGNWAGKFGNWAGGFGNWAGKFGNWAGGFGNWAGGFGNWAGGFGNWAGGFGNWAGSLAPDEWVEPRP